MLKSNLSERRQRKPLQLTEKFDATAGQNDEYDKGNAQADSRQRTVIMWLSFLLGFGIGVAAFSFTWYSTFLLVQHAKSRSSTAWTLSDPKVLVFVLAIVSTIVFYSVLVLQGKCVNALAKRVKNSETPKETMRDGSHFFLSETLKVGTLAGILTVWGGAMGTESEAWEAVIGVLWIITICIWYSDTGSESAVACDVPSPDNLAVV